jgi:hypothetical protein
MKLYLESGSYFRAIILRSTTQSPYIRHLNRLMTRLAHDQHNCSVMHLYFLIFRMLWLTIAVKVMNSHLHLSIPNNKFYLCSHLIWIMQKGVSHWSVTVKRLKSKLQHNLFHVAFYNIYVVLINLGKLFINPTKKFAYYID